MTMAQSDVIRAKAMTCQESTQELIPQEVFAFSWESDVDDRNGHAAIFEVEIWQRRQKEQSRNRASDLLNSSLLI